MKRNAILRSGYLRLNNDVKLRKEYFGGLVFHGQTGAILEVDSEAHQILYRLKQAGGVHTDTLVNLQAHAILPALLSEGIVIISSADEESQALDNVLSAPETVHLAVTYRCEGKCLDCYTRERASGCELDTTAIYGIIDDIARQGVFQLAIGGGEPFLRPDLGSIARHAAKMGLAVHITTGQYDFESGWVDVLKHIKSLHVGIRSEPLATDTDNMIAKMRVLSEYAKQANILFGANLIITRFTIRNLSRLAELLVSCGFQRLIFLRYKPIADTERWNSENPDENELNDFSEELIRTKRQYPGLSIRLDCAASFLMKGLDEDTARMAGIKGCTAADRIISVSPDGSVYPCSQLAGAEYHAGNLTRNSLGEIWRKSEVLNRFRKSGGTYEDFKYSSRLCVRP